MENPKEADKGKSGSAAAAAGGLGVGPAMPIAREPDGRTKRTGMKPPPPQRTSSLGLLAKSTAALPSGVVRVQQLREEAASRAKQADAAAGGGGSSSGSATGNPRNKTALAPGHSLIDWIRLGSTGVDLTGVGGRQLTVTPAELAKHNKEDDAWVAIRGVVYNVTRYLNFHPGGIPELMKGVGKDATKLFDDVHAWVNYQSILQKCIVGRLERSAGLDLAFESAKEKPKQTTEEKSAGAAPAATPAAAAPAEPVIRSPRATVDWRQTTNSITLYFSTPSNTPSGECQIKRLSGAEFTLRVCLEKIGEVVVVAVKLADDAVWPPTWQRSAEGSEIKMVFSKQERRLWKTYGSHAETSERAEPARRTYNEYEVLENTPLCKVVHLLVLRARNYIQIVPPSRHVEAKMDVMGTEVSRLYTPVPCCLHPEHLPASAEEDRDHLCLMVKRYEEGALSPRLTSSRPGDRLLLSCSLGEARPLEAYEGSIVVHMLAAGTGLTAMLPIIRRIVARRSAPSMKLINFNRNEDSIFYAAQLARVSEDRSLSITHVLSEAGATWRGRTGTVSEALLKDLMGESTNKACIFICGPPGFMRAARGSLEKLGWTRSQMHEFDG